MKGMGSKHEREYSASVREGLNDIRPSTSTG